MFDKEVMKLMKKEKYREIYMKQSDKYGADNPLNAVHLMEGFLKDMELEGDFSEYCKMRFEIVEGV